MLDLSRTAITVALGHWDVAEAASFEAGSAVGLDGTTGEVIVAADGDAFMGVAKWNKSSTLKAVVVDEEIVLPDDATNVALLHANVSNVKVADTAGTPYTVTTDYTVNATNGTVVKVGGGGIADGETVLVTYTYELTAAERNALGLNYMNDLDDTLGSGKITVIQDYAIIYTDQFDTSQVYTFGQTLTVATGLFKPAGGSTVVARVVGVPTPSDPFLGLQLG